MTKLAGAAKVSVRVPVCEHIQNRQKAQSIGWDVHDTVAISVECSVRLSQVYEGELQCAYLSDSGGHWLEQVLA